MTTPSLTPASPAASKRGHCVERFVRPLPRCFDHFPETAKCPICGTNDDGQTVLVAIAGTAKDGIAQAKPTHLACAIIKQWDDGMGMGFTWPNTQGLVTPGTGQSPEEGVDPRRHQ